VNRIDRQTPPDPAQYPNNVDQKVIDSPDGKADCGKQEQFIADG
jgi:hypothetical protein